MCANDKSEVEACVFCCVVDKYQSFYVPKGFHEHFYSKMALLQCPDCGNSVSERATVCPKCGAPLKPSAQQQVPQRPVLSVEQNMYLNKFHWGPFSLNWIWALCNNLPLYGIIVIVISLFTSGIAILIAAIIFGIKGNRWAWEKSTTNSFEEFVEKQDSWDKWGLILFFAQLSILIIVILKIIF